jgi:hypothetical protein
MKRTLSLIALLAVLPVALDAQGRRTSGGGGGGRGFSAAGGAAEADALLNSMAESPNLSKDLQKANPIETLLDKKKDLKLTSDEEKELKTINSALKESTKPYFKTIDSVAREMKKPGDYAPTQGQIVVGRQVTRESSDSVMAKYGVAAEEALAKLAEERRRPALELLQKERESQMGALRKGGRPPL